MADCERLVACIFFNDKMGNMPSVANILKARYCKDDNSKCARFIVLKELGKEKVPADLFPQEVERAQKILKENAK